MKEIIDIIKKIQSLSETLDVEKNKGFVIDTREKMNVDGKKEYPNTYLGELLQELDETKDVKLKMELLNQVEEEILKNKKELTQKLEENIKGKIEDITKRIDVAKNTVEGNIKSWKKARDNQRAIMASNSANKLDIYENIQKENEILEDETRKLNKKIKEDENLKELLENISNIDWNKENSKFINFESIIEQLNTNKTNSEQEQKEVQGNTIPEQEHKEESENVTPEQEQLVQKESSPNQTKKQEPAIDPSYTNPLPQEVVIDNEIENIVIDNLENKVDVNMPNYNISLSLNEISSQEQDLRKALSVDTLNRLEEMQISNTQADEAIIKGLLINEEKLNQYLNMCEKSEKTITKTDKDMYSITMFDFPKIEYKLDNLKKSKLNENQKLEMYKKVKASEKMFKKFGLKNKINIKMSLMDKAYFNVKSLVENLKSTKALKPANRNIIDNQNTVTEPQDNAKQEKSLKERIEFKRDKQAEEDLEYKALKALVDKKQGDKPKDKGQEK